MIVCLCRNISHRNYKNKQDLFKRLLKDDKQCCHCIKALAAELKLEKYNCGSK